jgi:hypothetical protein
MREWQTCEVGPWSSRAVAEVSHTREAPVDAGPRRPRTVTSGTASPWFCTCSGTRAPPIAPIAVVLHSICALAGSRAPTPHDAIIECRSAGAHVSVRRRAAHAADRIACLLLRRTPVRRRTARRTPGIRRWVARCGGPLDVHPSSRRRRRSHWVRGSPRRGTRPGSARAVGRERDRLAVTRTRSVGRRSRRCRHGALRTTYEPLEASWRVRRRRRRGNANRRAEPRHDRRGRRATHPARGCTLGCAAGRPTWHPEVAARRRRCG